jgi:hypothetical protein
MIVCQVDEEVMNKAWYMTTKWEIVDSLRKLGWSDCHEDPKIERSLVEGDGKIGSNMSPLMHLSNRYG